MEGSQWHTDLDSRSPNPACDARNPNPTCDAGLTTKPTTNVAPTSTTIHGRSTRPDSSPKAQILESENANK